MNARVIKTTLEYDGTNYAGWQLQPDVATVQGVVEDALARILKEPVRLHGAGRTDAGVHAAGQVAHFETSSRMTAGEFKRALNSLLPDDVRILAAEEAAPGFHARFSARSRTYRYAVTHVDSVFTRRQAFYVPPPLNVPAMRKAGEYFLGVHDFAAFGNASEDYRSTVREVTDFYVEETINGVEFYVTANAFLYKMVRNVVAVLLKIGAGDFPPEAARDILAARERKALGPPVPPQGLTLIRVTY